jgi:ribosomal protein S18 acetylase RimI-like enzyme
MDIIYKHDVIPTAQQVIELYDSAALPRPTHDADRIALMYKNSNLVVTAWDNNKLVGVSRTITDWVWSAYLADLAISPDHQKLGIGKKLVDITREKLGELSMLLLLSVPTAFEYYPKIGFTKEDRAFMIPRVK